MMMKREDYKAIKHMNKEELTNYLQRVFKRGYEDGYKAGVEALAEKTGHTVAPITADGAAEPDAVEA